MKQDQQSAPETPFHASMTDNSNEYVAKPKLPGEHLPASTHLGTGFSSGYGYSTSLGASYNKHHVTELAAGFGTTFPLISNGSNHFNVKPSAATSSSPPPSAALAVRSAVPLLPLVSLSLPVLCAHDLDQRFNQIASEFMVRELAARVRAPRHPLSLAEMLLL